MHGRRIRDDEEADAVRRTQSLAGLAISLLLVVVSLALVQVLHSKAVMEDCLLSGRSNCGRGWSWPMPPVASLSDTGMVDR